MIDRKSPTIDMSRHLLSRRAYSWDNPSPDAGVPITPAEAALAKRRDLANDTDTEGEVLLTPLKTQVAASLLEEFAARLRSDVRNNRLDEAGQDYIQLVEEMAEYLQEKGGAR